MSKPASETLDRTYTLMNRTHEVLRFRYDASEGSFVEAGGVIDARRAPVGIVSHRGALVRVRALEQWWKYRAIPRFRDGIEGKLEELGYCSTHQIPFGSLGLSLADQYWICPDGCDVHWEDVNYFQNDFGEASEGVGWLDEVGSDSPDNTLEGELPKLWVCKDGKRLLVKGGLLTGNQQPYNEVVATALYRRLLQPGDYIPYTLQQYNGYAACVCEAFVNSEEELIPAQNVVQVMRRPIHHNEYRHYLDCCARLGVADAEQALAKMIVCDSILANTDRHWRNFGVVRNVETLECRAAPLFDTGTSLWCTSTFDTLSSGTYDYTAKPFYDDADRQLRLVSDYSWYDPAALDGFVDEMAGILGENHEIADRIDYICSAVQARIALVGKRR